MRDRQQHLDQLREFLAQAFGPAAWQFELPQGHGHETYFASNGEQKYFAKLGADLARCQAMAALGMTPEVLTAGQLADGTPVLVQPFVAGRNPTCRDYRAGLEQVASAIRLMHHSPLLKGVLPAAPAEEYSAVGRVMLQDVRCRWLRCRPRAPQAAEFVDASLVILEQRVCGFTGAGLAASHNDICNANWLVTPGGRWYLVDLESMALDDPALDIGATLWWYYPPALRPRFLELSGYAGDEAFVRRMQVRMALHCLHILLPRESGFDRFSAPRFVAGLEDFRAALAGEENPQGYEEG